MIKLLKHIEVPVDAPFLDSDKEYKAFFINHRTGVKTDLVDSTVGDDDIVHFLFGAEALHNFEDGDILSLVFFEKNNTEGQFKKKRFRVVDMGIPHAGSSPSADELLPMLVPDDVDAAIAGTPSGQDASELEIANTEIDKVLAGTSVAQDDDEREISNSEIDSVIN